MIYCLNHGLFRNGLLNYQVLRNLLDILLLLISNLISLSPMNILCIISFGIYPDLFYGVARVLSWWLFHVYFAVVECSVLCWVSHSVKQNVSSCERKIFHRQFTSRLLFSYRIRQYPILADRKELWRVAQARDFYRTKWGGTKKLYWTSADWLKQNCFPHVEWRQVQEQVM